MQTLDFDSDIPSRGNMYFRVKQKGDQIQFRLAQNPTYVGKHFIQKEDGWDVPGCPRINSQEECEMCELYFGEMAEVKKLKEVDPPKAKLLEREARKHAPAITFYFPVLNRDTQKFVILQTTGGVRNKMKAQHDAGIDVFKRDWILRNTGSANPGEIYSLIPVDSAETEELTPEEEIEFQKAKDFDLMEINDGASQGDELE
jgi:hypothetical protein